MLYYRLHHGSSSRLIAKTDKRAYDLTSAKRFVSSYRDLIVASEVVGDSIDDVANRLIEEADSVNHSYIDNEAAIPIVPDEVWAAGVTYEISEEARKSESTQPDIYLDVYDAERPELFFKATASRTVGPGEDIGIRGDSEWDVPEPELALVLFEGDIVGYTIGNDVSSRDIEGKNPLYLPQAKVYDRSAALGPCVASPSSVGDPLDLEMTLEIRRDGNTLVNQSTSTGQMVRTCEDLASAYRAHNESAELAVLMTGTSLVPEDDFTLVPGDDVIITIESIGTLRNGVTEV